MTGSAWKVLVSVGQEVEEDQEVAILESMKMDDDTELVGQD